MARYVFDGKRPLRGSVAVGGSRQVAVWLIAASLLTNEKVTLTNVPHTRDVDLMLDSLRQLGVAAEWTAAHEVTIEAAELSTVVLPHYLPVSLLSSALFFGALLARSGRASLGHQGEVGGLYQFFVYQLEQFGASVALEPMELKAEADQLRSTRIRFSEPTVAGTVQALFLAVLAMGQSVIEEAAAEPEVDDLLAFLTAMGAHCQRVDERTVVVDGVPVLHGLTYAIMPDRLAAVVFGTAALITEGDVLVRGVRPGDLLAYLAKLQQLGAMYKVMAEGVRFWANRGQLYRPIVLEAKPYPGFSSAWLPVVLPLLSRVDGTSTVAGLTDKDRRVLGQLATMGMETRLQGAEALVFGPTSLRGGQQSADSPAEALALVMAALGSAHQTSLAGVEVLDHVLEHADGRLVALGAKVRREEVDIQPVGEGG